MTDKTPIQSILSILISHNKLNKECPEVLEIIESYLAYERYTIEKAFRTGKELGNSYLEIGEDKFYLTANQYYIQTFKTNEV